MDGRRWLAAVLLLVASACGAIAPLEAADEARTAQSEDDLPGLERPDVDEIFRDGRYDFQPAPKAERVSEKLFENDPLAAEGIEDVVANHVFPGKKLRTEIIAIALLLTDLAVEDPATWDGFLRGVGDTAGEPPEENTLDGAKVAYVENDVEHSVLIYYARDLIVMVAGPPSTTREELEDMGSYLLDAR